MKSTIMKYAQDKKKLVCENDAVLPSLYTQFNVKRGLRDINGKGVLTGLTNVSKIVSFDENNVPCDGKLWYRGYRVETLINKYIGEDEYGFEKIAYLLLFGELPTENELADFKTVIAHCRKLPRNFTKDVIMKAPGRDIMNSMTKSILTLASYDKDIENNDLETSIAQCIRLIALFPLLAVYGYHAYNHYKNDPEFNRELTELLNEYAGRPSRLYYAAHMTEDLGGAKIYLKREDLNHTGAHKINNVLGQVLLAKKMGKTRVIAETGAGQHGVATATAAALMGMECEVFMGKEDTERQALNVYKMRLLGAKVHAVTSGTATLKDAVSETMREWTNRIADTHYVLGSVMGPHPFPTIVRDFQAVISKEIKEQMLEKEGRLPDVVLACVGGGSNAIGTFYNFIDDKDVRLIGCEAAGRGVNTAETAATIATGRLGIFHGMKSYFCQDEYGQIAPVYSISAGLDYPGVGPEHAHLYDIGRAEYVPVTDDEAVDAFEYLSRTEGIIPAIESAHAVAYAKKIAPTLGKDKIMVVTISGRGDKDCAAIARYRGEDIHE